RAGRNGIVGVGAAGISPDRNVVRARLGEGIAQVGVDAAGAAVVDGRVVVEGDAVAVRIPQVQVGVERYGRIGAVVDVERGPGSRFGHGEGVVVRAGAAAGTVDGDEGNCPRVLDVRVAAQHEQPVERERVG